MRRDLLLVIGLLALAFIVPFFGNDQLTTTTASHESGDVAPGGYAAWYELLEREGVHVTRFHAPHADLSDASLDTLIVAFPDSGHEVRWDGVEEDALDAWVRSGGRLIDVGPSPSTGRDDARNAPMVLSEIKRAAGALRGPWAALVGSLAERGTQRIVRHAHGTFDTLLRDHAGALVVQRREGRGEEIGVFSAAPFENGHLAVDGDARLAYLLARPRVAGGVVAFDEAIHGDVVDRPWYRALDVRERVALLFLVLAGLAWLAYGLLPLGPPVRLVAPREPTSEEFLDAFAALYRRGRARTRASDALVSDALRRLETVPRTPTIARLAEELESASAQPLDNDRTLLAIASVTHAIREEATRGGNTGRRPGTFARGARARHRRR
jgi:hypothetical protein